jgi:ribose transport system permease protein
MSARSPARIVFTRELGLLMLLGAILVLFRVLFPVSWDKFATFDNFASVVRNMAFEGILALGMMLMMVGGAFDLSVGATASMIGVVTGWLMKRAGWPVPAAVAGGLALAALSGFINGFVVAKVRVNALITTLGTMGIFSGIALLVGGPGITFLPESFARLGQAQLLGLQAPVWLMAVLGLAAHYSLAHTRYFRQFYYVGSNPKAAHLSGLSVERLQITAFTLMGLLAGLAGIVYAARVATASSTVGVGKELGAITACILGGASLQGGRGTAWGALLGVFFVALIQNMLLIKQVRPEWQGIILGLVLVFAVAVDSLLNRKQQR